MWAFSAPDLWPAEIDEDQLSQVIQNLVINAGQDLQGRSGYFFFFFRKINNFFYFCNSSNSSFIIFYFINKTYEKIV